MMLIKELTYDSCNLLKEIVKIPSQSFIEDEKCSFISSFLTTHSVEHRRIGNNIIAFKPASNSQIKDHITTLMICAHMDTVKPCEGYTFDPYNPDAWSNKGLDTSNSDSLNNKEKDNRNQYITGLGSNDDGASLVAMIAVYRYFFDINLNFNLLLVLDCEEECSGPNGMRMLWDNEIKADFAIVGEPTQMKAATSERGLLVIDATAKGVSGHAARSEGVNAITIALNDITRLQSYKFEKVSPIMGEVKLNVTQISAGTAHNVIPDRCKFVIDIRPNEMYTNEEILENLQSFCESELVARNLKNRSSATRKDSIFHSILHDLNIESFSSATTSDWMRIDCDAIKIGPGDSKRSHNADEYVTYAEIKDGMEKYIKIINSFNTLLKSK